MCYAIPGKVVAVAGESATIDYGGVKKEVNVTLLDNMVVGDYVLVHAGFAIQVLDRRAAEKSLRTWKSIKP